MHKSQPNGRSTSTQRDAVRADRRRQAKTNRALTRIEAPIDGIVSDMTIRERNRGVERSAFAKYRARRCAFGR